MRRIEQLTYLDIRNELFRLKSKEMKTNFFITESQFNNLKTKGYIVAYSTDNGCFVFVEDNGFTRFYFIVSEVKALFNALEFIDVEYNEGVITIEIAGKREYLLPLQSLFSENNFYQYSSMVRMSKVRRNEVEVDLNDIYLLDVDKKRELQELFSRYFDKFVERIPSEEEIDEFIDNKCIYYYSDNDDIQGFIIFEHQGFTSHLRYWFVHPEYREKKIGSKLIQLFFAEGETVKRELFWVIESNENAIKRYKHFGFVEEDMHNMILINKDKKYEK